MTTVSEAQHSIRLQARTFGSEQVALSESFGRVLVQTVSADRDYPPFNRATMDGYAVQSADFTGINALSLHIVEYIPAGKIADLLTAIGSQRLNTPSGIDANSGYKAIN